MKGNHSDIVTITKGAVLSKGRVMVIVTEYHADGCVTWREEE